MRRSANYCVRFGALGCLVIGGLGATLIGMMFDGGWAPDVLIDHVKHTTSCTFPEAGAAEALGILRVYVAHSNWLAMVAFEATIAAIALVCAVVALVAAGRSNGLWRRWEFALLLVLGLLSVVLDAREVARVRMPGGGHAFLSQLLSTLPLPGCQFVRDDVFWARFAGEPGSFVVGLAMTATAAFARVPRPSEVAARLAHLQRLLYVVSLLFVAGIMMSRANFSWVLSHWEATDDKTSKALSDVIRAGVVQSGVAYSTILAVFFLPVRTLLALHVSKSVPLAERKTPKARKKWLAEQGLSESWQKDARQVLALLAPILSAPVFDAVAKF